MQVVRLRLAIGLLAGLAVACSGAPGATQAPGGAATPGPQATSGPVATPGGGGGTKPAGWDANGKVQFTISGPVTVSDELGFFPVTSVFGGMASTYLTFTVENTETVFAIVIAANTVAATYTSPQYTASGTTCTSSNLKVEAATASGSIECTQVAIVQANGATLLAGKITATFDAH